MPQFSYCHLAWLFLSRTFNNKINRIHERCLRIDYGDKIESFKELLDRFVPIHMQNLLSICHRNVKNTQKSIPPIFNEVSCFVIKIAT